MKFILALGLLTLALIPQASLANGSDQFEPAYDETFSSDMDIVSDLESTSAEKLLSSTPEDLHRAKMVIVINKSTIGSTSQIMRVYLNGELTYEWKVSTGREKVEKAKSGRVYLTTTPVGYYRPTKLVKNYRSNTWLADMPNAVFFVGGIAIHASTHIEQLGQRASGGCVRLSPRNARTLYELISKMQIEKVDLIARNGRNVSNNKGDIAKTANRDVLIIVENRI